MWPVTVYRISHRQNFLVLWATAALSCEQNLFSLKKWHFEKSLHFPSQGPQKKVLSQDSLLEEIHLYALLKNKKKRKERKKTSFPETPWESRKRSEEGVKCVEMFMKLHIDLILSSGISLTILCAEVKFVLAL